MREQEKMRIEKGMYKRGQEQSQKGKVSSRQD